MLYPLSYPPPILLNQCNTKMHFWVSALWLKDLIVRDLTLNQDADPELPTFTRNLELTWEQMANVSMSTVWIQIDPFFCLGYLYPGSAFKSLFSKSPAITVIVPLGSHIWLVENYQFRNFRKKIEQKQNWTTYCVLTMDSWRIHLNVMVNLHPQTTLIALYLSIYFIWAIAHPYGLAVWIDKKNGLLTPNQQRRWYQGDFGSIVCTQNWENTQSKVITNVIGATKPGLIPTPILTFSLR